MSMRRPHDLDRITGTHTVAVGLDQPGLAQDLQVVADQRLGCLQFIGQVGHAQLLRGEQLHDPPAQRVAQRPGQLHRQGLRPGGQGRRRDLW